MNRPDVATNCSMLNEHLEPAIEPDLEIVQGWFEWSWLKKVSVDVLIESMRLTV